MTFDPKKPCRLSDGIPARILATDLKGAAPIAAAILPPGAHSEEIVRFRADGRCYSDADMKLVNVVQRTLMVAHNDWGIDVAGAPLPPGSLPSTIIGRVLLTYVDGKLYAEVVS
jgi:hypothetical protein